MEKVIYKLSTKDEVIWNQKMKSIAIMFHKPQKVLSTSLLHGAFRKDLLGVFNHDCGDSTGDHCKLRANTYVEHLRVFAKDIGFSSDLVTGMGTAAQMENVAIVEKSYRELTVTAIVTGGIEGNGGRAGDPADYYAPKEKLANHKPGTINIILVLDTDLSPGVMARALVTCTEAKTAALQELMAGSLYSNGLATGSGTDQTIIIANPQSKLYFEGAGKHSKLGELIGLAVKEAVTKALKKQTGLDSAMQHSVLRRWKRFGVTKEQLWKTYCQEEAGKSLLENQFYERVDRVDKDSVLVTYSSLYIHLLDQYNWQLLSLEEVSETAKEILFVVAKKFDLHSPDLQLKDCNDLILAWVHLLINLLKK